MCSIFLRILPLCVFSTKAESFFLPKNKTCKIFIKGKYITPYLIYAVLLKPTGIVETENFSLRILHSFRELKERGKYLSMYGELAESI